MCKISALVYQFVICAECGQVKVTPTPLHYLDNELGRSQICGQSFDPRYHHETLSMNKNHQL